MRDLTIAEVDETHGALGNVAIGAVAGGIWGGGSYLTGGGGFTWSGLGTGVATGAIGGAVAGMSGFAFAFYGGGLGMLGGIVANKNRVN
jgi:hypothetical protein